MVKDLTTKGIPLAKYTPSIDHEKIEVVYQPSNYVNQQPNQITQSDIKPYNYATLQNNDWCRDKYQQLSR